MAKQQRSAPIFNLFDRTVKVSLTKGLWTTVDFDSYQRFCKDQDWCAHHGYATALIDKKRVFLHRLIIKTPSGFISDHIDGNRLNNTRKNLRISTKSLNSRNALKRNSTTGIVGVYWDKIKNNYGVRISVNRRQFNLGHFSDFIDAVLARIEGERSFFGDTGPYASRPDYKALVDFVVANRCGPGEALRMREPILSVAKMAA